MSRQTRRVSRLFIVILLLSFSAAALSFIYRMNHPGAGSASPPPPLLSTDSAPEANPTPATQPEVAPSTSPPMIDAPAHIAEAAAFQPAAATEPSFSVSSIISSAQSDIDNGRLLSARAQLNDALQGGELTDDQIASVKTLISQINQTVIFGRHRFADDPYGGTYVVQPGDSLTRIALAHDCTWEMIGRINGIDPMHLRAGATIKVIEGPFFAVIDKHKFTMDLYLGGLPGEKSSMYVTTYRVGLGKDDSTPVGTWMVEPHRKLKHPTYYSPRGEGVIPADDPKNPLGGYWIGLSGTEGQAVGKLSYGIHGTVDPDSIGKQSSMGCIRLHTDDIAMVYDMLVEGKSMVVLKE
ncbi:MAG: L,D-transpeptidase family protein [Tepidisphaeraceae bacterium]